MKFFKKSSIFFIDAKIILVVCIILSVIFGIALYIFIQQSKSITYSLNSWNVPFASYKNTNNKLPEQTINPNVSPYPISLAKMISKKLEGNNKSSFINLACVKTNCSIWAGISIIPKNIAEQTALLLFISSAEFYHSIQIEKARYYIIEMKEVGKAWEQYLSDTKSDLPKINSVKRQTSNLVENTKNIAGWNGPYLNYKPFVSRLNRYTDGTNSLIGLLSYKDIDWTINKNNGFFTLNSICDDGNDPSCYLWVYFGGVKESYYLCLNMDKFIDKEDGPLTGKLRCKQSGFNKNLDLYYKYTQFNKPI